MGHGTSSKKDSRASSRTSAALAKAEKKQKEATVDVQKSLKAAIAANDSMILLKK